MSLFNKNNNSQNKAKQIYNDFISLDNDSDEELIPLRNNTNSRHSVLSNKDSSDKKIVTTNNNEIKKENKTENDKKDEIEDDSLNHKAKENVDKTFDSQANTGQKESPIYLEGERAPVAFDEKTRHDDAQDFILTQKHKQRVRKKKSHHTERVFDDSDTPIVMSMRGRGDNHHHHSRSSSSRHHTDDSNFLLMSNRGRGEKSHSSHSNSSSSHHTDDTPVLMSERSRSKHHHHHHSHHSHHHSHHSHHDNHNTNNTEEQRSHRSHSHHHHKRNLKKWQKILLIIGCVLLSILIVIGGSITYLMYNGNQQMMPSDYAITAPENLDAVVQENGQSIIYKGNTYVLNKNMTGILFMGIDKEAIEGTYKVNGTNGQADVIILMAVDTSTGKSTLINISRDIMTDVAVYSDTGTYVETSKQQICLSYAYGKSNEKSAENTLSAVERIFYNFPISSYYALDLNGISAINDAVGGIDVVSPETIGEFEAGKSYLLTGKQSEQFVRLRDTTNVESNNLRMQRQQTYLNSFMDKLISQTKQDFSTPLNLFNASKYYSSSNLNPSKISYLAANVLLNSGFSIESAKVPGTIKMGEKYAEYYIDEEQFFEMFLNIFYNKA